MKTIILHQTKVSALKLEVLHLLEYPITSQASFNLLRMTSLKVTQKIMVSENHLRLSMQELEIKKLVFKIS